MKVRCIDDHCYINIIKGNIYEVLKENEGVYAFKEIGEGCYYSKKHFEIIKEYVDEFIEQFINEKKNIKTIQDLIKAIRKIIGKEQNITLHIVDKEVWMEIYESSIPITINIEKKNVFVDFSTYDNEKIDTSMFEEITKVMRLLNENIILFEECIKD